MRLNSIHKPKAGCLVVNDSQILLIKKNGAWQIPKGKIKKEESTLEAAIRETEEETGIRPTKIENTLFFHNNIVWFVSNKYTGSISIAPQKEKISNCSWLDYNKSLKIITQKHLPVLKYFSNYIQK